MRKYEYLIYMNDKHAIDALKSVLTKYPLTHEEQEAVRDAIGVFAWTSLSEGRLKNLKRASEVRQKTDD